MEHLYKNNGINQSEEPFGPLPEKPPDRLTNFDPEAVKRLVGMNVIYESPASESYRLSKFGMAIKALCQNAEDVVTDLPQKSF